MKSLLSVGPSVCLSVCMSVWHFSQEYIIIVFSYFYTMVDNWNIKKVIRAKRAQNGSKNRVFWTFRKILSFFFLEII